MFIRPNQCFTYVWKKDKFYEKMSYFVLISWNNPKTSLKKQIFGLPYKLNLKNKLAITLKNRKKRLKWKKKLKP